MCVPAMHLSEEAVQLLRPRHAGVVVALGQQPALAGAQSAAAVAERKLVPVSSQHPRSEGVHLRCTSEGP